MDVQMPILDGYRATHLIRHHSPYSDLPGMRAVPIVAMTASAIQGDREKCKRAGMDDYLAKPVKGKTLEKMLVKWALESKRKSRLNESCDSQATDHDSNCIDPESSISLRLNTPPNPVPSSSTIERARSLASSSALPGTESEADRGMRRVEAEEKATSLRDDKLLAASQSYLQHTNAPDSNHVPASRPVPPTAALTAENMEILDRAQNGETNPQFVLSRRNRENAVSHLSNDSLAVGGDEDSLSSPSSTLGELRSPSKWTRGKSMKGVLSRNDSDRSQKTVTALSPAWE